MLLAVDLGILNRRAHVLSFKEAMSWSLGLIGFALGFGLFVLWREGGRPALEYYTGYLVELSLSVDNLFVFLLIFDYFGVPAGAQPKVLKWGILGAIVMRLAMIALGALLLQRFEWITWVFGGILILTGIRMWVQKQEQIELERTRSSGWPGGCCRSHPATTRRTSSPSRDGRRLATPLFLVLLVVEWSDLVFAIDSIPAVFAVTRDPFLVFSSNVFAILGLRALFFVLAGMIDKFVYLRAGRGPHPGVRRAQDGAEHTGFTCPSGCRSA